MPKAACLGCLPPDRAGFPGSPFLGATAIFLWPPVLSLEPDWRLGTSPSPLGLNEELTAGLVVAEAGAAQGYPR